MRVVFINGAPRSGKDTAARMLQEILPGEVGIRHLGDELKRAAHRAYGLAVPPDYFEAVKDEHCAQLGGARPRDAYIAMYRFLSSLHGTGVLGERLAELTAMMRDLDRVTLIVPDLGRVSDAVPTIDLLGASSVSEISLVRPGCSFRGDSREPVDLRELGVRLHEGYNSGTLEDLKAWLVGIAPQL